jgi:hypothetical protein
MNFSDTYFFCSESDVALIIKYCYHDQCAEEEKASSIYYKDPKCKDKKKTDVILDNKIKLPALMFGQYLEHDCQGFIDDCNQVRKKYFEPCFFTFFACKKSIPL